MTKTGFWEGHSEIGWITPGPALALYIPVCVCKITLITLNGIMYCIVLYLSISIALLKA